MNFLRYCWENPLQGLVALAAINLLVLALAVGLTCGWYC